MYRFKKLLHLSFDTIGMLSGLAEQLLRGFEVLFLFFAKLRACFLHRRRAGRKGSI